MDKIPSQIKNMEDLVEVNDDDYKNKLRMDRRSFHRLCYLIHHIGGLHPPKYITVEEKVTMMGMLSGRFTDSRVLRDAVQRPNGLKVPNDPLEGELDEYLSNQNNEDPVLNGDDVESLKTTTEWTSWRDTIAENIMDPIGTAMRKDGEKGKTTHRRRSWPKVEEDALI
ncbi:hypothetical protein ACS0TY_024121 [Phlomoides rotata]